MVEILDASQSCGAKAPALAAAGVRTVIRYYSRDTLNPAKRLTAAEARQLAGAGLQIGIVHEARRGNQVGAFSKALGLQDAAYAAAYGADTIDQPAGSAIYFGVDFDASPAEVTGSVLPYFEGVTEAMAAAARSYRVGVYGSGATCKAVLDQKLADLAWLAQSTGWTGYKPFLASNRWALRQEMDAVVATIPCDPDVANPAIPDFGAFTLAASSPALGHPMQVIARGGLNLRAGPGLDYAILKMLAPQTRVWGGKVVGDWVQVDLAGDGMADGFANIHFLAPDAA